MITTIKLRGSLGRLFCKELVLDIISVADAIRGLCANFPEFQKEVISEGKYYKVITNKNSIGLEANEIGMLSKELNEIEIIPVVSGSDGGKKIIAGIILVAAAYFGGQYYDPGTFGAAVADTAMNVGVNLILSGAVQLLFKPPEAEYDDTTDIVSYNFSGPVNTTPQGLPVPLGYGELLVGSSVISVSLDTIPSIEWVTK